MKVTDVLYFLAELAVYVAVAWWGFTVVTPSVARWALAVGLVVVFAVAWGLVAAPRAVHPLPPVVDAVFRLGWFGLGLAAAVAIVLRGLRST